MKIKVHFEVKNETKEDIKEVVATIKKAVKEALKYEMFEDDAVVSITLTNNENIKELNTIYRGIEKETDCLSFPTLVDGEFDYDIMKDAQMLGDIVISLEKASQQADEYNHSFEREVAFLAVHSTLHLLGYDHELSKEEEKDMFFRQEEILKNAKILR